MCKIKVMKDNNLTPQQIKKINFLLSLVKEHLNLSIKNSNPVAVIVPFSNLEKGGLSFAEAKHLLLFLNREINNEETDISILNGTLFSQDEEIIGDWLGSPANIYGVDIEDEKDSLILYVYNFNLFLEKVKSILKDKMGCEILTNIKSIDILEDKTEHKKVILYINKNYSNPIELNRGKYSEQIYNLAKDEEINYTKGLYSYFNSNKNNPLYKKYGFLPSVILKKEDNYIVPNIDISIIGQKKLTQLLNKS